ncbi:MAG: succinate--CoA ligase subunit alpha [Candidatus Aegiribacteria sp.]|nr:succinate--CoA ligase subunit alpha [Candidatus Aegiribacteria sp.]
MAGILKYIAGVETPRTLVFGITGKQGRSKSRLMRKFGTEIIAGCTPGKGGQEVDGVPVFNSAAEAVKAFPQLNSAVLFVPAGAVRKAAMDAMDAGLKFLVLTADGVPTHDEIILKEYASTKDSVYLGPNTVGLLDTEGYLFGLIGGSATWAKKNYRPGKVGVISRSGGLSQLLGAFHCRPDLPGPKPDGSYGPLWGMDYPGLSAVVCVGGDPVPGISMLDTAAAFEKDPRTEVMAVYGETGTTQENDLAEAVMNGEIKKPIVVFLGGKFTKAGVSQSHAGAMIRNENETWEAKQKALLDAGITVVERPDAVFSAVLRKLKNS